MAIDFQKWESRYFNPFLWDFELYNSYGCGASLIATLTGESPVDLFIKNKKNNPYWPESLILSKIRRAGYKTLELTVERTKQSYKVIDLPIKEYHILLTLQYMTKGETSWQLIWGNYIFHNFEIRPLKPLEFINNPLIKSWIIKKS
jgi:hypothetical protein